MSNLPALLAAVTETANELRDAEDEAEKSRARFYSALKAAHKAGASYALLGRMAGLTRQRIARIVGGK